LPRPVFENISDGFQVVVFDGYDEKGTEKGNVPENVVNNVVENELKIIEFLNENNTFSAKALANKMEMTERTIQRYLKTLGDKGVVRRIGPAKGGHWEINK